MADPFANLSVRRATRLFGWSASVFLLLIPLAWINTIPSVDAWLDSPSMHLLGPLLIGAQLITTVICALVLWAAAIWYARVSPDVILGRNIVTVALIATNFVGSFFYYWLAVHWRPATKRIESMKNPFLGGGAA